jgi:hypothetical protein
VLSKPPIIRGIIQTDGSPGRADMSVGDKLRQRGAMRGERERRRAFQYVVVDDRQPCASILLTERNIPASDRGTLEGLTQFRFVPPGVSRQTIGTTRHLRSNMRERRFCATLFRTARNSLILNGEMSEWSIEHAWKLLWRLATACYGFRLPLRSQPLNDDRVTSVDHRKPR